MNEKTGDGSDLLQKGIDLFNAGEYFECHEVLEMLWNMQCDPEKQFTQALIQIAVGCYHLDRENIEGAVKLFTRGLVRIRQFAPTHEGLDVDGLILQIDNLLLDRKMSSMPRISSSQSQR